MSYDLFLSLVNSWIVHNHLKLVNNIERPVYIPDALINFSTSLFRSWWPVTISVPRLPTQCWSRVHVLRSRNTGNGKSRKCDSSSKGGLYMPRTNTKNLKNQIWHLITLRGRGWVFVAQDFARTASVKAVQDVLNRLVNDGEIRQLDKGIFDYPRAHRLFGLLSPDIDDVAQASARRTRNRVQMTGAQAVNALGLSTQVPARAVYLTDGKARRIQVGKLTIDLLHVGNDSMVGAGDVSGTVVQALDYLGPDNVDAGIIARLHALLSPDDKQVLRQNVNRVPLRVRPMVANLVA